MKWIVPAKSVVNMFPDPEAWQGISVETSCPAELLPQQIIENGRRIILDFGETLTGRVRLRLESLKAPDSPIRLKFLAAELPYEAYHDPDTYTSGLGRGWFQEELITAYDLPAEIELPRRCSLRYLVIDVAACPCDCGLMITRAEVIAQSSVGSELPSPLPGWDREFAVIDRVCSRTLRNCMQEFPEDGPKRDRRLWLGDLRLQALVNHVTYKRYDLFERGIRLLHSCKNDYGMIPGAILMSPKPHASSLVLDYALLFGRLLLEHCRFSGDFKIGDELFADAEHQLDFFRKGFDGKNSISLPPACWMFIDHVNGFERYTPCACIAIWAAEAAAELAALLNKPDKTVSALKSEAEAWRQILRSTMLDKESGLLRSGRSGQLSWASQIWGVLSGVLTQEEGRDVLSRQESTPDMIKPQSPYLMHYFLEACCACGLHDLLFSTIRRYWGGMVSRGADTFWEIYNEENAFYTPYGNGDDPRNNSACHAWSGTPGWFLRNTVSNKVQ